MDDFSFATFFSFLTVSVVSREDIWVQVSGSKRGYDGNFDAREHNREARKNYLPTRHYGFCKKISNTV